MAEKIEDIVKTLVDEGNRRGYLTFQEMNKLLEDQFVPPDKMDQIFVALEDAGVDVLDEEEAAGTEMLDREEESSVKSGGGPLPEDLMDAPEAPFERSASAERIDDPVRMYLTQMGESRCSRAIRKSSSRRQSRSRVSVSAKRRWVPALRCSAPWKCSTRCSAVNSRLTAR